MEDVCCIISAISSHTEVSLEKGPRCVKLLWKVDNLLCLGDFDNRNCCPSKIFSDQSSFLGQIMNITYKRGETQQHKRKIRYKRLEEGRPTFQLPLQPGFARPEKC